MPALSLERPAPLDPDPPGPVGDLKAEIEAFSDLRTCARAHRPSDAMLADGLEALGYDNFITDACRAVEALKARDTAPCAAMLSTPLRRRCEAQVAMFTGRPELCPADERIPGFPEREPSCLAAARRDARPCVALPGMERATCEGVVAHDLARCGVDERCLRTVRRWSPVIPLAVGRPLHAGRIQVLVRPPGASADEEHELPHEAELGAAVAQVGGKARLLVGDPRGFFILGEQAGGGMLLTLPSWPPRESKLTLQEGEARVALRLRDHGVLEVARLTSLKITFEEAPVAPYKALKFELEATLGPSHAQRRTRWVVDTWLRDVVSAAPAASAPTPSPR